MTPLLTPLLSEFWTQAALPFFGIILSGGLIKVILDNRRAKRQEPIDSATAASLISEKAGNMALAIAERQDREIKELREIMQNQRRDMNAMDTELRAKGDLVLRTREEIKAIFQGFRTWYFDKIVEPWETVRQNPVPPDPPAVMTAGSEFSSMLGTD